MFSTSTPKRTSNAEQTMNKQLATLISFTALSLTTAPALYAQDASLSLFEPVASEVQVNPDEAQNQVPRNTGGDPAFTLIGTSRIGNRFKVTLAASDGEIVHVTMAPGSTQDIPDHPGFRIVDTGSRTVAISSPRSSPCIEAEGKGVTCRPNGVSELALATAAPVSVADRDGNSNNNANNNGEQTTQNGTPDVQMENPFAAALRAAAENDGNGVRRGRRESFQAQRIPDEDVPPGMRRVRTPFGDRLVEQ